MTNVPTKMKRPDRKGFTFIETLVALAVLTIVISVTLETQFITIRAEQNARSLQSVRHAIDRIRTQKLEERHRQGYLRKPVRPGEFGIGEKEQEWGGK